MLFCFSLLQISATTLLQKKPSIKHQNDLKNQTMPILKNQKKTPKTHNPNKPKVKNQKINQSNALDDNNMHHLISVLHAINRINKSATHLFYVARKPDYENNFYVIFNVVLNLIICHPDPIYKKLALWNAKINNIDSFFHQKNIEIHNKFNTQYPDLAKKYQDFWKQDMSGFFNHPTYVHIRSMTQAQIFADVIGFIDFFTSKFLDSFICLTEQIKNGQQKWENTGDQTPFIGIFELVYFYQKIIARGNEINLFREAINCFIDKISKTKVGQEYHIKNLFDNLIHTPNIESTIIETPEIMNSKFNENFIQKTVNLMQNKVIDMNKVMDIDNVNDDITDSGNELQEYLYNNTQQLKLKSLSSHSTEKMHDFDKTPEKINNFNTAQQIQTVNPTNQYPVLKDVQEQLKKLPDYSQKKKAPALEKDPALNESNFDLPEEEYILNSNHGKRQSIQEQVQQNVQQEIEKKVAAITAKLDQEKTQEAIITTEQMEKMHKAYVKDAEKEKEETNKLKNQSDELQKKLKEQQKTTNNLKKAGVAGAVGLTASQLIPTQQSPKKSQTDDGVDKKTVKKTEKIPKQITDDQVKKIQKIWRDKKQKSTKGKSNLFKKTDENKKTGNLGSTTKTD